MTVKPSLLLLDRIGRV